MKPFHFPLRLCALIWCLGNGPQRFLNTYTCFSALQAQTMTTQCGRGYSMNEGQSSKKEQKGDFRRGGGRKRSWPRSRPSPGRLPDAAYGKDARGPPRPSPPPQAGQPPGSRQAPGQRGWDRRSPRLRARRRDPGGKALRVRHFGCLCRSVQLPREPPTETRGGREAAAALSEKGKKTTRRRRCPGRATR